MSFACRLNFSLCMTHFYFVAASLQSRFQTRQTYRIYDTIIVITQDLITLKLLREADLPNLYNLIKL